MDQPEHSALAAYEATAACYDDFTAHHDYELTLSNFLPAIESRGLPPSRRLLDVGCGTGNSFLPMLERGWSVTACDLSPAMIQVAREKLGERSVELAVDERALPESVEGHQAIREVGIQDHQAGGGEAHPDPHVRRKFLASVLRLLASDAVLGHLRRGRNFVDELPEPASGPARLFMKLMKRNRWYCLLKDARILP